MFCGIGGFHQAAKNVLRGAECAGACDKDAAARAVYELNHGVKPRGDIRKIDLRGVAPHDLLFAGFPCPPFSSAQRNKGRADWEHEDARLYEHILDWARACKPAAIVLENVAALQKHDIWKLIKRRLAATGYAVSDAVLSAHDFGAPQTRFRVFLVARLDGPAFDFAPLEARESRTRLRDVLPPPTDEQAKWMARNEWRFYESTSLRKNQSGRRLAAVRSFYTAEHAASADRSQKRIPAAHSIYDVDGVAPTVVASAGVRVHVVYPEAQRARALTNRELATGLMGFPSDFVLSAKPAEARRHIGNSVCVKVVEELLLEMRRQGVLPQ